MVSTRNRKLKSRTPPPKKSPAKKQTTKKKSKSPAPKKKTPAKRAKTPKAAKKKTPAKKTPAKKKSKSPAPKKKTPAKRTKTPTKRAKSPAKKAKSPAKRAKSPAKKAKSPAKRAKSPAKKATPKAAPAPKEAPKASSPLPLSTEQIWTLTNYFYLALFAVALIPDSFGLNDKAHSFLIPGADTADKDTFTRFCTMLGLFGYINLSGARPQNLATACASMSFTFTLWTYMAYTQNGDKQWGVIALYGTLAFLNFFGGYGQDSIAADGTDSQKFIWGVASFLWTLTAVKDLITPSDAMDINAASNANLVRMIALAIISACSINIRSPPADLADGLRSQRTFFLLYVITPMVLPMLGGNMAVTETIKAVLKMKGMQMVLFNFAASFLLSA